MLIIDDCDDVLPCVAVDSLTAFVMQGNRSILKRLVLKIILSSHHQTFPE
jgi:hypothetical protein